MGPGSLKGKSVTFKHQNGDNYYFACDNTWYPAEMHVEGLNVANKPAWLRVVRAMTVLEHIGGTAAFTIFQDIATGNSDALPTNVAKEMVKEMLKAAKRKTRHTNRRMSRRQVAFAGGGGRFKTPRGWILELKTT